MVIDSSAIIALLLDESGSEDLLERIEQAEGKLLSTATYLEICIVYGSLFKDRSLSRVDRLLESLRIQQVEFDGAQAVAARDAWLRYGKGRGKKAQLNYGDCFAYALAKTTGEPLLFKGRDFASTDVSRA